MRRFVCISISNAARRHKLCVLSRQQEQLLVPIVLDVARWLGVTGDSPPPATMISYALAGYIDKHKLCDIVVVAPNRRLQAEN